MDLDDLIKLAKSDSDKTKDAKNILAEFLATKKELRTQYKTLEKRLKSKFEHDIVEFSKARQEFNLTEKIETKEIQVGTSNIFLKFIDEPSEILEFFLEKSLHIAREDIKDYFIIDLSPLKNPTHKCSNVYLNDELKSKIKNFQLNNNEVIINNHDLSLIENRITYLKEKIEMIRSLVIDNYVYSLKKRHSKTIFKSSSFQEVVESALGVASNLK